MSDHEYIVAFRVGNQRAITSFYAKHRKDFLHDIGSYFHVLNSDLLSEIFQESVIRLWKNITSGKLSEDSLSTTLAGYLFSIGRNVAMEIFRREGIRWSAHLDDNIDSESQISDISPLWTETEQEVAVRSAVYAMGEPCAPLLLMFYWDRLSWESIACELHYKDANSAKSQKYKCIQKLKAQFV